LKHLHSNEHIELRGAQACINLKHDRLVNLFDILKDETGTPWIVMEYVQGSSLRQVIDAHPSGLPYDQVLRYFRQLAEAVEYLHENRIAHRDLKPANIFLENDKVKVGDYGLSKVATDSQTQQTALVGTIHYMAPEYLDPKKFSAKSPIPGDIYSAGVILFEMLTGKLPYDGQSMYEVMDQHIRSQPDTSRLPARVVPVLTTALRKDPMARFGSIRLMVDALEDKSVAESKGGTRASVQPDQPTLAEPERVTIWGTLRELCSSVLQSATLVGLVAIGISWIELTQAGAFFLNAMVLCAVILVLGTIWNGRRGNAGIRHGVMTLTGLGFAGFAFWADGWTWSMLLHEMPTTSVECLASSHPWHTFLGYVAVLASSSAIVRWWKLTERGRVERYASSVLPAVGLWIGLVLLLLAALSSGHGSLNQLPWPQALSVLVSIVAVQLASPWEPTPEPAPQSFRRRLSP
jgi:hypothetical protein